MDTNGALKNTVQSQVMADEYTGLDVMPLLIRAGELIPPYWSKARDWELSRYWQRIDHVSSALSMFVSKTASIPLKITPRDMSIKSHVAEAEYLNSVILNGADFGKGWYASLAPKMIMSYITQDNGCFVEVIGDGKPDKMRVGPVMGFADLDPQRCQRTSNPIYPVIFWDIDGNKYKLHHSRVMFASSVPNFNARLNGVGFCALSRMINTAQHLLDMATAEQEELGSRPKRRLIIGKSGITLKEIVTAFEMADTQMDNEGLSRYSRSVVIAPNDKRTSNTEINMDVIDLLPALKGDDKERSITLGMFLIALALNIPPRWIWPASQSGATKADAMFQHVAGMGGGIGYMLQVFKQMLGGDGLADVLGKPIPGRFNVEFDYQDDEQDRAAAEIRELRSKVYTANLASGVYSQKTAWQQALDVGDITEQQFDDQMLEAGYLPDGTDVLNLFMTTDSELADMLSVSVGDVLNPAANDAAFVLETADEKLSQVRAILANPQRPKTFGKAKQAFAALVALKALYSQPAQPTTGDEPPADDAPPEDEGMEDEQPTDEGATDNEPGSRVRPDSVPA